jgi:hypothetical protein
MEIVQWVAGGLSAGTVAAVVVQKLQAPAKETTSNPEEARDGASQGRIAR